MQTITASELQKDVIGVLAQLEPGASILITSEDGHAVARLEPVESELAEPFPEPPPWSEIMAEVWKARDEIKDDEIRTANPVLEERKRRRR